MKTWTKHLHETVKNSWKEEYVTETGTWSHSVSDTGQQGITVKLGAPALHERR